MGNCWSISKDNATDSELNVVVSKAEEKKEIDQEEKNNKNGGTSEKKLRMKESQPQVPVSGFSSAKFIHQQEDSLGVGDGSHDFRPDLRSCKSIPLISVFDDGVELSVIMSHNFRI